MASIKLIEHGNEAYQNEAISNRAKSVVASALESMKPTIPITDSIYFTGVIRQVMEIEVRDMVNEILRTKNINNIKIPKRISEALQGKQKRFGLITYSYGFTRTSANLAGQYAKGVAMSVASRLTLGTAVGTSPVKALSSIYVVIVDVEENKVVFFNYSRLTDGDPLKEKTVKNQIKKIMSDYFAVDKEHS